LREVIIPAAITADVQYVQIIDKGGENLLAALKTQRAAPQDYRLILTPEIFSDEAFVLGALTGSSDHMGDKFSGVAHLPWGDFFCVSAPLRGPTGETIGAVLAGISLGGLVDDIRARSFAETTMYSLTGEPVVSTLLAPALEVPRDLAQEILAEAEGKSYLRIVEVGGVDFTELLAPLEIRGGSEIGLLGTALRQSYLMQSGRITRGQIAGFVAFAILLVVAAGLYLSHNIAQPLARLAHAANQVASGNFGVQLGVKGGDEIAQVARAFNKMVVSIERSNRELISAYDKTIEGWSRALEMYDQEVQGHTQRVAGLTVLLARAMHIRGVELDHIQRGALLHDIGKMAIPDVILHKPSTLSAVEREVMQLHTQYAAEMLSPIEFLEPATVIPKYHHEKWDGSGYPYGLAGEAIPLAARIFSVVDVYDAMSSDRPYRYGWLDVDVIGHLRRLKGRQFDPVVVDTFIDVVLAGLNGTRKDD
jgi:putative nucleotidyltransferase with HDIG domain